ncbi:unnamed protein product [Orchesella dallaii]|uniref:DOMON domain-containing protein n=1 Tax=Orchesella dallaii TaxID=48710 RepID=A0ABP1PHG0_9HEXA
MKNLFKIFGVAFLLLNQLVSGGIILKNDKNSVIAAQEALDPQGSYLLSWDVDLATNEITFEVEAATTKGYIDFGISPTGGMAAADIFSAGVYENGTTYAFDMHGDVKNGPPIEDTHSDWELIEARENESKIFLFQKFSRLLNTCDDEDYPISNDTVRIIWSMGETDDLGYHNTTRGTKSLNLLMPDDTDFNPDEYLQWNITSEVEMPKERKRILHTGVFEALLENDYALEHTHHFIIFKCVPPSGQNADEVFGPFVNHTGSNCYAPSQEQELPVNYCLQHYLFVWAKGGHRRFKTGARISYTNNLREIEAGMLTIAHEVHVSLAVPPNQKNYIVAGQCGSKCTELGVIEEDGINVFNSLLHAHLSGKTMKLRHLRGEEELPWFDFDNHYGFNFQQNKPLLEPKKIMKGDHLTIECTYNNVWNKGKIVVGGLSTREEMCMAFLWYYPKIDFEYCGSYYPPSQHFQELGITNYSTAGGSNGGRAKYIINEPIEFAGDYEDSLSTKFNWTEDFVKEFEHRHRYNVQSGICQNSQGSLAAGKVQFPVDFLKFAPEDVCDRQGGGDETTTTPPGGNNGGGQNWINQSLFAILLGYTFWKIQF